MLAGGGAGVADEVGEADAVERIAEQGEAGERAEPRLEFGRMGWMSYCILGKAVGPAADHGESGRRSGGGRGTRDRRVGVEDAREFEASDGGDLVVVAAGDAVGSGPTEEDADQAAVGRDAVGELLVDEGAGEQKAGRGRHC